jgi:formylglycine-generating enzyme required for sulfatase activity
MRILVCAICIAASAWLTDRADAASDPATIPSGSFRSVLPAAPGQDRVGIHSFKLDRTPVSNAQFAKFLESTPQWRRDRVASLFADDGYLSHWANAMKPGASIGAQPVTRVSWFAATAYCEARGGRLPMWHEWEYVAAADEHQPDARNDPQWRQRILNWYAAPGSVGLPDVGSTTANVYGIQDLHGVIWEWVQDVSSMMVSGDSREQGSPDVAKFCGSGALAMEQKENYAILMRVALLSSLQAKYTTANVGFRCAFDVPE